MRPASLFAAIVTAALATSALAQAPPAGPPTAVRGTVETLEGHTLTVKSRNGASAIVALAPNFTVRTVVAKTLDDIKPGDKVDITSVKGSGEAREAVEIHILPTNIPNLRLSEFSSDLRPDSLMTNGVAAQVASAPQHGMLKVTLNGKEREVTVPPGTPIVGYGPGEPSPLKPGTTVVLFDRKQPDGSLSAANVTAEKDGVKPPM